MVSISIYLLGLFFCWNLVTIIIIIIIIGGQQSSLRMVDNYSIHSHRYIGNRIIQSKNIDIFIAIVNRVCKHHYRPHHHQTKENFLEIQIRQLIRKQQQQNEFVKWSNYPDCSNIDSTDDDGGSESEFIRFLFIMIFFCLFCLKKN